MTNSQDVEAVIRRLAEARDEALWKVLYLKCRHRGKIKPITEPVGVKFPQEEAGPARRSRYKRCFAECCWV